MSENEPFLHNRIDNKLLINIMNKYNIWSDRTQF